jgi:cytochrome c-type biogenesis protein CcmH
MLARSYKVMGRTADAEKAFDRSGSFIDNDAQLLADDADTVATNAGGSFVPKATALINKALKADPNNNMALWLAGSAAYQANDFDNAIANWDHLVKQIDPNSEDVKTLQAAIEDAKSKGGKMPGVTSTSAAVAPKTVALASQAKPGAAGVSGMVLLDAALKGKSAPSDTLLVIARQPGVRMPVAVLRVSAADLPVKFTLDDSTSMNPQAPISSVSEVEVEARISKSGLAMPESGDLISKVQTVKVGAQGVTLRVDQVRP